MTPAPRADVLERLSTQAYDLLVVGGGIVGSRVALDAARSGLRVALVDKGDFGAGTSSASTKLVHGGLRYLATGQLRLVREAQRERQALEEIVAPGLVWSIPLVLATTPGGSSRALLPVAMTLYRALAGRNGPRPKRLSREDAPRLVPGLRAGTISSAVLLREGQTNDARLTLATVRAAAEAGADVANYVALVSLEQVRGRVVAALLEGLPGERSLEVRTRAVVNATGPWVDHVRRLEDPRAEPAVRLSRGANLTLALDEPWAAALALFDSKRSVVAAPWHGLLLLGATDTPYEGDPSAAGPTAEDIRSLLESLADVLPDELLRPERVLYAFAGLRALARGQGSTAVASRDHILSVGPGGMVSVAGGKLTTHRLIARAALGELPVEVRPKRLLHRDAPLAALTAPVAVLDELRASVGSACLTYLVELYGARVTELADDVSALRPIAPGGPDLWAQAAYARDVEWALCVDDVVRRRTTLELRGLATPEVRAGIAETLGLPQAVVPQAILTSA